MSAKKELMSVELTKRDVLMFREAISVTNSTPRTAIVLQDMNPIQITVSFVKVFVSSWD